VYFGAQIGAQLSGTAAPWDMAAVSDFASVAGKAPSIVSMNLPFMGCSTSCDYYHFPTTQLSSLRTYGSIPFLNWASMSSPLSVNEPNFRLAAVAVGTYDSYIRAFATEAKTWGHPFFLRFNWEMNGDWFPWAEAANGNKPGDYAAAWRHVHDIFTSVGATNATWVWCPSADFLNNMTSLAELYPGAGYVNWTCIDGYNFGTAQGNPRGWLTFDQIFSSTYNQIVNTIAPGKPMIIGEMASTEQGGSKAAWITSALSEIPQHYPMVRGLIWFDVFDGKLDWPIETSTTATAAFRQSIADPLYTTNTYTNLTTSPIPPPRPPMAAGTS
jgi:hypothetical protein